MTKTLNNPQKWLSDFMATLTMKTAKLLAEK
jgi:hypothetical protein